MYLLDTNVVSEFRKVPLGRADARVARWVSKVRTETMFVSVITILEIQMGILRLGRRDRTQAAVVRNWLQERVLTAFDRRVLHVDIAIARYAAGLHVPDPRPFHDALIAATAAVHGHQIVTRNVADFADTGIRLLNPWTA